MTAVFGKIALSLGKFAGQALQDVLGLNQATKQRAALEGAVVAHIASEPALLSQVRAGTLNVLAVEKEILATVRLASAERSRIQAYASPLTGALMGRGMRAGPRGATLPGGAAGFVPNYANAGSERAAAAAGGYRAGSIKTMNQPGAGTMMYNSAETVKKFPGMAQSAIMPPQGSPAGAGYKAAFGASHGFDPYAAGGFVPNFMAYYQMGGKQLSGAGMASGLKSGKISPADASSAGYAKGQSKKKTGPNEHVYPASHLGVLGIEGTHSGNSSTTFGQLAQFKSLPAHLKKQKVTFSGMQISTINAAKKNLTVQSFSDDISREMTTPVAKLSHKIFGQALGDDWASTARGLESKWGGKRQLLPPGAEGSIFEAAINLGLKATKGGATLNKTFDQSIGGSQKPFDFEETGKARPPFKTAFGFKPNLELADAKRTINVENVRTIIKKAYNSKLRGLPVPKALGHVPNFSPLTSAIGREMQAGVPASAIRVGSSSALKSAGNPGGVGVYNTIHEPAGLQQGISRSRSQGVNPKGHGVPNFVKPAPMPSQLPLKHGMVVHGPPSAGAPGIPSGPHVSGVSPASRLGLDSGPPLLEKGMADAGKAATDSAKASAQATKQTRRMGAAMGGMMVQMAAGAAAANMEEGSFSQTATKGVGSMAGYAGMGFMMGGPWGAAAGGAIGAVGMGLEIVQKHSDAAQQSLGVLAAKLEETQKAGVQVSEALGKVSVSLSSLETERDPGKRQQAGREIIAQLREAAVKLPEGSDARSRVEGMISGIGNNKNLPTTKSMEKLLEQANLENKKNVRSETFAKMGAGVKSLAKGDGGLGFISQEISEGNYGRAFELAGGDIGLNPALMIGRLMGTGLNAAGIKPDWMPEGIGESLNNKQQEARAARAATNVPGFFKEFMSQGTLADQSKSIGTALQSSPKAMAAIEAMRLESLDIGLNSSDPKTKKRLVNEKTTAFLSEGGGFEAGMSKALGAANIADDAKKALKSNLNTAEGKRAFMDYMYGRGIDDVGSGLFSSDVKGQKAGVSTGFTGKDIKDSAAAAEAVAKIKIKAPEKAAEIGVRATRDFVEGLRKGSVAAKNQLKETQLQIVQSAKLRKIQDGYDIALAKATRDTIGLADAKLAKNLAEAAINFKDASTLAKDTFDSNMANDVAGFAKTFEKGAEAFDKGGWGSRDTGVAAAFSPLGSAFGGGTRMTGSGNIMEKESQINLARETFKGLGSKGVNFLRDRISDAQEKERKQTGTLSVEEKIVKEFGPKVLEKLIVRTEELDQKMRELGIQHVNAQDHAKAQAAIDKKMLELSRMLNTEKAKELRLTTVILGQQKVKEAARRRSLGQIGGKDYYATEAKQLDDEIAERGIRPSDFGKGMTTALRGEMAYDPIEYFNDLKAGSTELASTMKSSFADTFQSIASGANSVQGAFAKMAQSILDSISSMSANMFSNMMFSKMGFSQGGTVPGYAAGGVVTGGSGYKDDVPTMMQGGEFVIKKSSAQKIGYGKLNAINGVGRGYAQGGLTTGGGGPSMMKMGALSAGASALSGIIQQANTPGTPDPIPSRDYGFGKSKHGFLGGADPDAGQTDSITGGRGRASASLGKGFVYYRRDPETGRLISERARPTEGRFEVSQRLSLLGRLGEDDPQTSRMFGKEQSMSKYQNYLETETQSRKDQIDAVKRQKRGRLVGAYMNAAMLIGGAKMMQGASSNPDVIGSGGKTYSSFEGSGGTAYRLSDAEVFGRAGRMASPLSRPGVMSTMQNMQAFNPLTAGPAPRTFPGDTGYANGGGTSGSPAMVMGGEYIMSPETVRTYGTNFMSELNRGNVAGYANGGPVGGGSLGNQGASNGETPNSGNTTNNVKISVNVDKSGKADTSVSTGPQGGSGDSGESDREEVENNKALGKLLQGVVLEELVKQQRPGGLLRNQRA